MLSSRTDRLSFLFASLLFASAGAGTMAADAPDTSAVQKNLQIDSANTKPVNAPVKKIAPKSGTEVKTSTAKSGNNKGSETKASSASPKAKSDSTAKTGSAGKSDDKAANAVPATKQEIAKPENSAAKSAAGMAQAENSFGLASYRHLGDAGSAKNLFISPYSLHSCLHLVFDGAAGNTAAEMGKVLGLSVADRAKENDQFVELSNAVQPASETADFVFSAANSIWANNSFKLKPEYVETAKKAFDAEVRNLDFAKSESADTINKWVSDNTHGKIPKILDQLSADEALVAVNAAYFKARWKSVFNKQWTKDADFKMPSGPKKVSMMDVRGTFHYLENDQMQAIELPYQGEKTSLVLCLPREKSSLADFRHSLTLANWDTWVNAMDNQPGELFMPKFTMQYQVFCRDFLNAAGMKEAFGKTADFSNMVMAPGARISQVVHKTFVKVDEDGTEAAAATAVIERALSLMVEKQPEPFKMVVDRPFFFAIMDWKTHAILFVGQVVDPTEG